MSDAAAGRAKYAVVERERRWLVDPSVAAAVVSGIAANDSLSIDDRYVRGTRLRLRTVTSYDGAVVTKLGHKAVVDPTPPQRIEHTSLYLDSAETDLLATLPADELAKDRHRIRHDGRTLALDVFSGRHVGLVLVELDLGARDDTEVTPPPFPVVAEVTADHALTGGALAATSRDDLVVLLAGYGVAIAAATTA